MAKYRPADASGTDQQITVNSGPEGPGTVALPHELLNVDVDTTPDTYTRQQIEKEAAWITRSRNDIVIQGDFYFVSVGGSGGTNCRGRAVMHEVDPAGPGGASPTILNTRIYYSHNSNSTGARLANGIITIPAEDIEPGSLYWVWVGGDVYGGDFPTGLPTTGTLSNTNNGFNVGTWFYMWGNRPPDQPVITAPANGTNVVWGEVDPYDSIFMLEWSRTDPDEDVIGADIGGYEVQFRPVPTPGDPNPAWIEAPSTGTGGTYKYLRRRKIGDDPWGFVAASDHLPLLAHTAFVVPGGTYYGLTRMPGPGTYQIRVRTYDLSGAYTGGGATENMNYPAPPAAAMSDWSNVINVNLVAPFLPPVPLAPINNVAQDVSGVHFEWQFRDPRSTGGSQASRKLRIRKVGDASWTEIIPVGEQAGASEEYDWINGDEGFTLEPGFRYEWQPNTVATPGSFDSSWTGETAFFWAIPAAGSGGVIAVPDLTVPDPGLGCGDNRVFVYARGGLHRLGEITNKVQVKWSRVRDDISECTVQVSGWSEDCGQLLAALRTWQMELVVFRDNGEGPQRVWEGPITRLTYEKDAVEVAAHDVMAYVYRRILRIGFNDAFSASGGGLTKVTRRAAWVIQNALSYDDPNLLAYMQVMEQSDDARNSRVVPEYSTTAWALVDDFAAKAGLDYVTVGRKIALWDTHNAIGLLPEMRDGDFGTPPIVTEYGMQLANYYAVTNNNGVWGAADRFDVDGVPEFYGYIEMLSSAYGESDAGVTSEVLTPEARLELEQTLTEQAGRNIAARYPAPLVARVPDNSTLNPEISVGINQLIPGVHVPLRSDATLRQVFQMQKLDRVEVTQNDKGEQVTVTLSPAPRSGADPDSEGGEEA